MAISTNSITKPPLAFRPNIDFVELLGRTNFSFLQGASHPDEMILQAKAFGYRGLAICDLNGLYGVVKGDEATEGTSSFIENSSLDTAIHNNPTFSYYFGAELTINTSPHHSLAIFPMNKRGYSHLCQLITLARQRAPKSFSLLTLSDLNLLNEALIACPLPPWNLNHLRQLMEIFPHRLYLPVWKDFSWSSLQYYQQALQLERELQLPLFATQRPLMHHPERKPLLDVLTCILHQTTLQKAQTYRLTNSECHLKPLPQLAYLWKERLDLLARTLEIADQLQFSLRELRYQYPHAGLPPGKSVTQYFRHQVEQGLLWRFPQGEPPKIRQLIEYEMNLITEMAYEDYFLTIMDICQFARREGILFQGRGSAANSVICYVLGLTAVDPTQIQLLFERFISKERGEPPDIDIDFASDRREEVIQYIYRQYGEQHAAMVATVICYRTRMALRETAKVLEIPQTNMDRLIKYMGREGMKRLLSQSDQVQFFQIDPQKFKLLLTISASLQGFPRHLGIHTGGFLISERPITESVPIEKASMQNRVVIQWNKDDLNYLKMMKIDILGLGMLTALNKCLSLLKSKKNIDLNLASIPAQDSPTYKMIAKADTVGVFQIESRAQMSLLPRLQPSNFYDLVIQVAIVRPGPIQGGMIHPFIRRRHGQEKVNYLHPDLENILSRTLGVPIFQEQVMQIASILSDFTPGEADELRRLMSSSWKNPEAMKGLRQRLLNGMIHHGISLTSAEQIYQSIEGFAAYGFPESHAASFALLTYASCYLKCHHPEAFVCSLLNSQPMGFYSPRTLIADAQRKGVQFLPLSIEKSEYDYTLEKSSSSTESLSVRVGFRAVYGLNKQSLTNLLLERELNGPFSDLENLVRRSHLPRPFLMHLASAGAFHPWQITPRSALWTIQALSLDPKSLVFGRPQETFNSSNHVSPASSIDILPKENAWNQLQREYHSMGFSLNAHPLSLLRPDLERINDRYHQENLVPYTTSRNLKFLSNGQRVRVAGLLSIQQRPPTAKGFTFLTLEDETGFFNVILKPQIHETYRLILTQSPLLEIQGILEMASGALNIKALKIISLSHRFQSAQHPLKRVKPTKLFN